MVNKHLSGKKDKKLAISASLATVDAVAAGIDTAFGGGAPLATGAWGLSKALIGSGMALRKDKALEWVEMVRDNSTIFTEQILESEEFQDAFVTSLEDYIKERNADKRLILRAIFLDYSSFPNPSTYPLERLNEITKQLTIFDAKNFSYLLHLSTELKPGASFQDTQHTPNHIESVLRLISLGLLIQDTTPHFASEHPGLDTPWVFVSGLGAQYYAFIKTAGLDTREA